MKRIFAIIACALGLPGTVLAATRTYDVAGFESVSIASGIDAEISVGSARSVVAETMTGNFDDIEISVEDNTLRIGRPDGKWFSGWSSGTRPQYKVHVATPALHVLKVSSGSDASVKGNVTGDFSLKASSGSDVKIAGLNGGHVKIDASSGSDIELAGSCVSLETENSSGSDMDAEGLKCESVDVRASSGSDVSVAASKQITGKASSSADIRVRGKPTVVNIDKSSGADVTIRE